MHAGQPRSAFGWTVQCSGGLFASYSAGFVHAQLLCDSRLGGAQKRRIQKSTNGRNGSTRTQPISGNRERVLAFLRCRGGVAVVGQMAAGNGCDTAAVPYAWIHVAGDAAFGRVVLWRWQSGCDASELVDDSAYWLGGSASGAYGFSDFSLWMAARVNTLAVGWLAVRADPAMGQGPVEYEWHMVVLSSDSQPATGSRRHSGGQSIDSSGQGFAETIGADIGVVSIAGDRN